MSCVNLRGVAQLGRAPALGAGGRWFESSHPDSTILDETGGCRFSCHWPSGQKAKALQFAWISKRRGRVVARGRGRADHRGSQRVGGSRYASCQTSGSHCARLKCLHGPTCVADFTATLLKGVRQQIFDTRNGGF